MRHGCELRADSRARRRCEVRARARRAGRPTPRRRRSAGSASRGPAARLDEAGVGERREVLRHCLPRHRQLAGELGRGRRPVLRQSSRSPAADSRRRARRRPARAITGLVRQRARARRPAGRAPVVHAATTRRPRQPRPVGIVVERELDRALVLPRRTRAGRSGSTSVTVACRSSPFDQRKLAPPPGRRSMSTSFANQSSSRSASVRASQTSSRGRGQEISRPDHVQPPGCARVCNRQVARYRR